MHCKKQVVLYFLIICKHNINTLHSNVVFMFISFISATDYNYFSLALQFKCTRIRMYYRTIKACGHNMANNNNNTSTESYIIFICDAIFINCLNQSSVWLKVYNLFEYMFSVKKMLFKKIFIIKPMKRILNKVILYLNSYE